MTARVLREGREKNIELPTEHDGTSVLRGFLAGAKLKLQTEKMSYKKYPLFSAISKGVATTHEWIGNIFGNLKMLITKRNIKDFGGPIMIVSQSFQMAQQGLRLLLMFLAIISVNLAAINILPIGALDGGQLLFETIEVVIRRKLPEMLRFSINLASWVLILGLILWLSFQDIIALFVR